MSCKSLVQAGLTPRRTPSSELATRVFRPEIIANIIHYAADDKRELCRLLKVSKVFYHEATRLLYRSVTIRFSHLNADKTYRLARVLANHGNKKNALAYIRHLEIGGHKKASCAHLEPFSDAPGHDGVPRPTLPTLKDLQFSFGDVYSYVGPDCDAQDCPLTRGLQPTGDLVFTFPNIKLDDAAIKKFKAAITRLSSSATSVTIDLDHNGPELRRFITTRLGAGVAKLTFVVGIAGFSLASDDYRADFVRACKFLIARLNGHKMDRITSIVIKIAQLELDCCNQCSRNSVETFAFEAACYKGIWKRQSRNLFPSLQSRVSVRSFQHTYPEGVNNEFDDDEDEDDEDDDDEDENENAEEDHDEDEQQDSDEDDDDEDHENDQSERSDESDIDNWA